jgi:hypothetical protein
MDVPREQILLGSSIKLGAQEEKLSGGLPLVLKVEQIKSQTAQLWDASKYVLLIGAILKSYSRCLRHT